MVNLRPVKTGDYAFLYSLLKEKTPDQNISHKEMPTWGQHLAFNNAKPYAEDYIIEIEEMIAVPMGIGILPVKAMVPVGRIYLTKQDEVGIHVLKAYSGKGIGGEALELILRSAKRPILANISPLNHPSQEFFKKHGFTLIQHTYRHP